MKSSTNTRGLLLFLMVLSLAITGSGVFADESKSVSSGSQALVLNAGSFVPGHGQPSGPVSTMTKFTTSTDDSLKNQNSKVVRNFSAVSTLVPIKSPLGTGSTDSLLFNTLLKS